MKRFRWCGSAVVAVMLALGAVPAYAAAPALKLTVDRHVLHSGQHLVATARAQVDCTWILGWHSQRKVGRGKSLVATFTAPVVTRATRIPVKARCFPNAPAAGKPRAHARAGAAGARTQQHITVRVPPSSTATVVVTVLPNGSGAPPGGGTLPPGSGLPPTGGPPLWLLLLGLGALLTGAFCVGSSRGDRENPRWAVA